MAPRKCSVDDAAELVSSGDVVAVGSLGSEPTELIAALCERADELRDVTVLTGCLLDGYPFLGRPGRPFKLRTWFLPSALIGHRFDPKDVEYLPMSWAQVPAYAESTRIDVACVQVAPPRNGCYSLGTSVGAMPFMLERAHTVIAVVNPNVPYTYGSSEIDVDLVDVVADSAVPLPEYPTTSPDAIDYEIAENVAGSIPDGALLQVGVGTLPAAVVNEIVRFDKRELCQFSMLTDAYLLLNEAGCLRTGEPGALVGEIVGSRDLYAFVDGNPQVRMLNIVESHSAASLLDRKNLTVLGSALEVDVFGQANVEMISGAQVASVGGSIDFLAAASALDTATAVTMLRSTTMRGRSRIVSRLSSPVTSLTRNFINRIATEYGECSLFGMSALERARAIVSLAHPDERAGLTEYIESSGEFCG